MLTRAADRIIHATFYILLFAVPFLFTPWNYELFEFNKMLATYALTVIIIGAWAIKCILSGHLVFRRTPLDIPLLFLLLAQILSTYFSIDRHTSIWGYYSRSHGGLLSTIVYLILYWAFVSNMGVEQVKTAIKYLLTSALTISIWGILEHFGLSPSCLIVNGTPGVDCWVQDVQTRVFATLGQPNWLAAWLVAVIPITWAIANVKLKTQNEKLQLKNQKFWVWFGVGSLLFLALLYTKSRSGLLGFFAAYIVFWSLSIIHNSQFKIQRVRPFLLFTFSFLILALATGTRWTPSLPELLTPTTRPTTQNSPSPSSETQLESGGTESGEIRKIVWKGALDIWRAYPLFGSGVETFAYSYYNFRPIEHNQTTEWDFLYNKAHNEYLNFAATTGTLGLFSYLTLILSILFIVARKIYVTNYTNKSLKTRMIREHSRNISEISDINGYILIAILAGYVSILVTNFFGFSVVNVATLFFLFPAFACVLAHNPLPTIRPTTDNLLRTLTLTPLCLLITGYLLLHLVQIWHADSLYTQGTTLAKSGQPAASSQALSEALSIRPDEPNYLDAMASSLSALALDLSETKNASAASETAKLAQEVSNHAIAISPRNLSILKSRSTTFYKLSFVDKGYLLYSIEALERAVILAPTDPKVHYNLGVLYAHVGEYKKAKELFEKTLQLKPDFEDAKTALEEIHGKI